MIYRHKYVKQMAISLSLYKDVPSGCWGLNQCSKSHSDLRLWDPLHLFVNYSRSNKTALLKQTEGCFQKHLKPSHLHAFIKVSEWQKQTKAKHQECVSSPICMGRSLNWSSVFSQNTGFPARDKQSPSVKLLTVGGLMWIHLTNEYVEVAELNSDDGRFYTWGSSPLGWLAMPFHCYISWGWVVVVVL